MALTVLMLFAMFVPVYFREGGGGTLPGPALIAYTFLAWLPLTVRTRWPEAALVAVVLAEALHLALMPYAAPDLPGPTSIAAYQPVPLATMVAAYALASRSRQTVGWLSGVGAGAGLLVTALIFQPIALIATDIMTFNLVLMASAAGVYVAHRRSRTLRLESDRQQDIQRNVVEERMRIARELHDVLAHNLTLINAQAGVAAYLMKTNPEAATTAMNNITEHTRAALDEVRSTVGLLRYNLDDAENDQGLVKEDTGLMPTPGMGDLNPLIARYARAGNALQLSVHGTEQPLSPLADLGAYRIIQEALTNAAKHAPGAGLVIDLTWTPRKLGLRIVNEPPPHPVRVHGAVNTGHGVIGMRERALTAGGTFRAGPTESGGFSVEAEFPVETLRATVPATDTSTEEGTQ